MSKIITEETIFSGPTIFTQLPKEFVGTLNGALPSVKNVCVFRAKGVVVTVTKFIDGAEGQTIRILGDGTTTIANNANIKTSTGANKLLAALKMYNFTLVNNIWYEDA